MIVDFLPTIVGFGLLAVLLFETAYRDDEDAAPTRTTSERLAEDEV